ncbi:uncharacterized protein [Maniola hyperantus]|uniref:uncharacterized protein isoform X1 n=1 Tax=Aphantopus hyperantus TaxID=2795564 RepID=UPI00212C4A91
MKELLFFVLVCALASPSEEAILSSVPPHLLDCYRRGGPDLGAPRRLDVFLSLLRRLELSSRLDMRMFSSALLRSLRLDGIEESPNTIESDYVLPFRASAFQFHKYKLLMELFLPSQPELLDVDESLTLVEKCLLHKMLSSSVQPWERGDENVVCPLSAQRRQTMMPQSANRIISRCPTEGGVIKTEWGTISPGTLVAALASSLQPQQVTISDILETDVFKEEISQALVDSAMDDWYTEHAVFDIDLQSSDTSNNISNLWAATLAGDLAEVVVNQGPRVGASEHRMLVGSSNRWNDTLLPRDYYLFPPNGTLPNWHFTDAEILAGIDGLILASHLPTWITQRRSLRLSQVLDMYYSNEGVSFDTTVRACNRHALYSKIVNGSHLMGETSRFAHMLSLQQITVYIPREEMERMSDAAATAFMNYVPIILRDNHKECRKMFSDVPSMDLIVATDGSWKGYEIEQFMSWIAKTLEVEAHRSTIALVHGNNGQWIVPPTTNLTSFYSTISNSTTEWPVRLNLPNVISRIIQHSRNRSLEEIASMASAGHSTVVLIVSPSDSLSSNELEQSRVLMQSLRRSFFDVFFAYVAQDTSDFQNVNNEYLDYSELFITVNSNVMADVTDAIYTNLVKTEIPSRIFGSQCEVNSTEFLQAQYEDFVLPGRKQTYRIHPFYLKQQPIIKVQFRNDGQGQILVCMWRGADASRSCQTIVEREIYIFNLTDPCPSPDFCPPAHFVATAITTSNLCAHDDCRLPNQVGYYIHHSGLRCLPLLGSTAALTPFWQVHLALSLTVSLIYHYYNETI